MKKKVIMTVLAVAVMGATFTGCGTASSQGESIEPVSVQTMAQSTEGVAVKATESVEVNETKDQDTMVVETEDKASVSETAPTTENATTKDTNLAEKAPTTNETPEQNTSDETENNDVDEEPYFGEIGNIDNLKVTIGDSNLYTKEELQSAVGYILGRFQVDFTDCVMTELNYDEAFSLSQCQVWADQYGADEAIVLTCTFNTTENYRELNMEPGQVCEGYNWILTRNEGEDWTLQTWGY